MIILQRQTSLIGKIKLRLKLQCQHSCTYTCVFWSYNSIFSHQFLANTASSDCECCSNNTTKPERKSGLHLMQYIPFFSHLKIPAGNKGITSDDITLPSGSECIAKWTTHAWRVNSKLFSIIHYTIWGKRKLLHRCNTQFSLDGLWSDL